MFQQGSDYISRSITTHGQMRRLPHPGRHGWGEEVKQIRSWGPHVSELEWKEVGYEEQDFSESVGRRRDIEKDH
jgi:hypothetical protein